MDLTSGNTSLVSTNSDSLVDNVDLELELQTIEVPMPSELLTTRINPETEVLSNTTENEHPEGFVILNRDGIGVEGLSSKIQDGDTIESNREDVVDESVGFPGMFTPLESCGYVSYPQQNSATNEIVMKDNICHKSIKTVKPWPSYHIPIFSCPTSLPMIRPPMSSQANMFPWPNSVSSKQGRSVYAPHPNVPPYSQPTAFLYLPVLTVAATRSNESLPQCSSSNVSVDSKPEIAPSRKRKIESDYSSDDGNDGRNHYCNCEDCRTFLLEDSDISESEDDQQSDDDHDDKDRNYYCQKCSQAIQPRKKQEDGKVRKTHIPPKRFQLRKSHSCTSLPPLLSWESVSEPKIRFVITDHSDNDDSCQNSEISDDKEDEERDDPCDDPFDDCDDPCDDACDDLCDEADIFYDSDPDRDSYYMDGSDPDDGVLLAEIRPPRSDTQTNSNNNQMPKLDSNQTSHLGTLNQIRPNEVMGSPQMPTLIASLPLPKHLPSVTLDRTVVSYDHCGQSLQQSALNLSSSLFPEAESLSETSRDPFLNSTYDPEDNPTEDPSGLGAEDADDDDADSPDNGNDNLFNEQIFQALRVALGLPEDVELEEYEPIDEDDENENADDEDELDVIDISMATEDNQDPKGCLALVDEVVLSYGKICSVSDKVKACIEGDHCRVVIGGFLVSTSHITREQGRAGYSLGFYLDDLENNSFILQIQDGLLRVGGRRDKVDIYLRIEIGAPVRIEDIHVNHNIATNVVWIEVFF